MRSNLILTAACLLAVGSAGFADGTPVTLLYKYTVGQDLTYKMTSSMTGTMGITGRSIPIVQTMTSNVDQVTTAVDPQGDGTLTMTYSDVKLTMSLNGAPQPVPAGATNNAIPVMTLTMSPQGKVLKITTSGGAAGGAQMSKMFSGTGQLNNLAMLPDHPVSMGDTWRGSMDMAGLGLQMYFKMTLNGINTLSGGDIANVAIKSYGTFTPAGGASALPVSMTGTFNGLGTMNFDIANGYPQSTNQTVAMNMSIQPPANSPASANGPISMVMNGTSSMTMSNVSMVSPTASPTTPTTTATPAAPTAITAPATPVPDNTAPATKM